MKFVTFAHIDSGPRLGVLAPGDAVLDLSGISGENPVFSSMLQLIDGGEPALKQAKLWADQATSGEDSAARHLIQSSTARFLAPIPRPRKNVYCVGLNYLSHVEQNATALGQEIEIPEVPLFFSKPVTAVIGPDEPILLDPRLTSQLDYEIELALVIGRRGKWISPEDAMDHVFGYTIANDVSARDLQFRTSQFLYGKGQDSYCPVGPLIATKDEIEDLNQVTLELLVNGELRQRESAGNMLFWPAEVISWLSQGITLEPGDVITLGTPGGCGYQLTPPAFLQAGDTVECRATGLGSLINPVIAV
ncbi:MULTISPECIES: fumarylacetoacetate hydrolase family protein [Arthrobacter]|uniref:FAA hydrolase family protein n=1 Tax=Arthrobacter terricola TaxID=2547396 RepID=A0A4R5KG07_9MICC|nr:MULTISPECIES: fumarylacetoacetate hydrolase family protein [Arthrobacter]MBT8159683.1 fumarylacetoacetate hydrolase family protein [Arthrobacter sp. GN70]TDF93635.1 FAA hydrolase family protein [Arthrobacter terricola]